MATDPERVKALFLAAIERDDPADRRAFLDAEVGGDAELRDRLDALLAAYDQPPGALDRPLGADPEATDGPDATRSVSSPPPRATPDDGLDRRPDRTTTARTSSIRSSPIATRSARRSARGAWARSTSPSSSGRSAARWPSS